MLIGTGVPALAGDEVVRTATLAEIGYRPQRLAPATVVSLNETTVSAQIAARVETIDVRVGDVVAAGDVIARLDCRDARLASGEAEAHIGALDARIELARRQLDRAERLTRSQTVAEEILDTRAAELDALRADRRAAVATLDIRRLATSRCEVRSPFRALVLERVAAVGQYATVGTGLVRALDLDTIEISAQVPVDDTRSLAASTAPAFEFDSRRFPLRLRTVLPAVLTATRTQEVRLELSADEALPGAAGKLVWTDARLHVPADVVVRRGARLGVFVVDAGRARFVAVTGAEAGRPTALDLPADTVLVVEGQHAMEDGAALAGGGD
ncbi:MAG: efflux RND transporter periplasmic adaptor subunit [Gammaproteobacteria bacterium]|nr:efflux RND transporter periplasmic adaptor subunit [Gammaproteobacteria bacterium]